MKLAPKLYIYGVIAAGGAILAASIANWSGGVRISWTLYVLMAVMASQIRLRPPGVDGTFSLNFVFLLFGIAQFSLPETLIAGCLAGAAQSLIGVRKRPTPVQVLFNSANLAISVAVCYPARWMMGAGAAAQARVAMLALIAALYFVVNTVLVSGVLSLLQGTSLRATCRQWYAWSFPYYLMGATLVGLLPSGGQTADPEAWLLLLPIGYLLHFFLALKNWRSPEAQSRTDRAPLPAAAKQFVGCVLICGFVLVAFAAVRWQCADLARFSSFFGLAIGAAMLKVRMPRMEGTIALGFVLVLVAIAELSLPEVILIATAAAAIQTVWRTTRRPMAIQVMFNAASLALSAALAYTGSRWAFPPAGGPSIVALLIAATAALYACNTVLVSTVLCLMAGRSIGDIWQRCHFWAFPYYLVGAAAAGLIVSTARFSNWGSGLLVLPVMALVYISYGLHVRQAAASA
jgi:hypothetical protein